MHYISSDHDFCLIVNKIKSKYLNIITIEAKNITKNFLILVTTNTDTPIEQFRTKLQETLEFESAKQNYTFSFDKLSSSGNGE